MRRKVQQGERDHDDVLSICAYICAIAPLLFLTQRQKRYIFHGHGHGHGHAHWLAP